MTLEQFLRKKPHARKARIRGQQTDWMDFCEFTLAGHEFLVVDAGFLPSKQDGLVVKAPAGRYVLQAKVMSYGCDRRISRLRALLMGADGRPGKNLGDTWTDTATTAVCDLKIFSQAWAIDDKGSCAKIEDALGAGEDFGIAVIDEQVGAVAPFVASGFGDGTYPVRELVRNGKRVGFDIEFIGENERYPFADEGPVQGDAVEAASKGRSEEKDEGEGEALALVSKALKAAGEKKASNKKEKRANLERAFKEIENQLLGEARGAMEEVRSHLKQVRSTAAAPKHKYSEARDQSFAQTAEARRRFAELADLKFRPAGLFQVEGVSATSIAGFFHPKLRLYAVLTFSKEGVDWDLSATYPNETSFSVTTATRYAWMPQPPWTTTLRHGFDSFERMLAFFLKHAPRRGRLPVSAESYRASLEPESNRHLYWYNDRGGLSREELVELIKQKNPAKDGDKEFLEQMRMDSAERALYNWLRLQEGLSFKVEDVIETLVIVHDEMSPDLLAHAYWCGTDDFKARCSAFEAGKPRESFSRVNAERGSLLQKVAEKRTGLPADYYLPAKRA